jgi:hypothetical protein
VVFSHFGIKDRELRLQLLEADGGSSGSAQVLACILSGYIRQVDNRGPIVYKPAINKF